MPKFKFISKKHRKNWSAPLMKTACSATTLSGNLCSKTTQKFYGVCSVHAKTALGLRVAKSKIPNAGLGLYNCKTRKKDDIIVPYIGELLTTNQLMKRYGSSTAPYAVEEQDGYVIDGAIMRGIASYANHKEDKLANAELAQYTGHRGVYLCAKRRINVGEEITVDYGDEYIFDAKGDSHSTQ